MLLNKNCKLISSLSCKTLPKIRIRKTLSHAYDNFCYKREIVHNYAHSSVGGIAYNIEKKSQDDEEKKLITCIYLMLFFCLQSRISYVIFCVTYKTRSKFYTRKRIFLYFIINFFFVHEMIMMIFIFNL